MRKVRGWFCCLGLVTLGSAHELTTRATLASYTIILMPDHPYSSAAVEAMQREASDILKRSGVAIRLLAGYKGEDLDGSIVVVNLRGRCDMDAGLPVSSSGPLGWTHSENGMVLPFAELACDPIRAAVQSALPDLDAPRGNNLLGRAMGRVLAHELYHIAGETAKHGRDGVAQEALSPRDLTVNNLELDPEDAETIRSRQAESSPAGTR